MKQVSHLTKEFPMKFHIRFVICLLAIVFVAGCASTKVIHQTQQTNLKIPRPDHIWVYDFAATPGDAPANSDVALPPEPQTTDQIALGRELGVQIAEELVTQIHEMGLPAVHADTRSKPQVRDLVIRGYLITINEGSAVQRVAIGFGSGASELTTAVEGYLVTPQGLAKIGSGTIEAGGGKTPGAAVPAVVAIASGNPIGLIVGGGMKIYGEASGSAKVEGRARATAEEIAEQLKPRFEQQGWIS
jgi:hypothetical protein